MLQDICTPEERYGYWNDNITVPLDLNWKLVHNVNFMCSIDTRLRSFYFKTFHKAIALNAFLFKIKRKDSPNCSFCGTRPETIIHLFCECDIVTPLWYDLLQVILVKHDKDFSLDNFKKMFGVTSDKFLSFLFLSLKYFIYLCKFKNVRPHYEYFKKHLKSQKETEYYVAKKRGKLHLHFKKWKFDL